MKYLSSLFLSLLIIIQPATASEAGVQGLKQLFDEFQYTLNVEWNQNDQNVADQAQIKFINGIKELAKQGLTHEELMNFSKEQIKDEKLRDDFEQILKIINVSKMDQEEMNLLIKDMLNESYSQGASWRGEIAVGVVMYTLLAAGLVFTFTVIAICTNDKGEHKICRGGE